ncbi:SAM-dependent methyltransferase [Laspinema sp. A4]|uniref:SAM-dependent methyltransferase n=1 Tax=Laspinema sp. D2d TaxID=2953686 RepID=UPI0021BACF0A|nr:SAM-dependent methyltransferase [Laspinema sp. D2d]MCT7984912.1 SAM-dependent methyltransferase [Laspinema sp. D2d]
MSDDADAQVSLTARFMAASRAFESQQANPLFRDPFAERLAGTETMKLIIPRAEEYEAQGRPYAAVRTRFFDDFLLQCNATIRQVVLLGAGMDTRAYRLDWQPETHLYELDRSSVLDYKETELETFAPQCNRHVVRADLREDWVPLLIENGYQPDQPSVWLLEGLLYYLSDSEVSALMKAIDNLTAPGSHFAADVINDIICNGSDALAAYWQSSCNEPETFFAEFGWSAQAIQPSDEGASFGRFTYQFPPRSVTDGPHIFFVTATKT